jgi:hypothetical protein
MMKKLLFAIVLLASGTLSLDAQAEYETQKLFPADNTEKDRFGWSVDMEKDFLIVGAPYDMEAGSHKGAAYIYERTENGWSLNSKIMPESSGDTPDEFGTSVSIDGDYLAVGSIKSKKDADALMTGSVYLYHREGTVWKKDTVLFPGDGWDEMLFGSNVSISGTTLAVAGRDERSGDAVDPVYIFTLSNGKWSGTKKILTTGTLDLQSVCLEDTILAIGYLYDEEVKCGAVHTYFFNKGNWDESIRLAPQEKDQYGFFGRSVSLFHNRMMVGAFGSISRKAPANSAYIFTLKDGQWEKDTLLLPADTITYDAGWFGNAVAINDRYALIGAVDDNHDGHHKGAVYVYTDDNGSWEYSSILLFTANTSILEENCQFGRSVSIYDTSFLAGAPSAANDTWFTTGAAFLYHTPPVVTGTGTQPDRPAEEIEVFPVPATDRLTIRLHTTSPRRILLTDLSGKIIRDIRTEKPVVTLNISTLQPGLYLIIVEDTTGRSKKKILKIPG